MAIAESIVEPDVTIAITPSVYHVIVVGGGIAGVGAAIKLRQSGITDFVVLEKAEEIGGVWHANTYPGCACDVPSALYSYSFAPNPHWSRVFAEQGEIKAYLQATAREHGVMQHVRLNREVRKVAWDHTQKIWLIDTPDKQYHARFVVMAGGPLHAPITPKIAGLDRFEGDLFHSARWRHDVDLRGKRVAVIGTGASAIQFVPVIQPQVGKLILIQRTPQWVLPKMDIRLPRAVQQLFKYLPVTQLAMRGIVFGIFETLNGSMRHPFLMKQIQRLAKRNLHRAVKDPVLREKLTPRFIIGCKRILQSNQWYAALMQPNVELVFAGVSEIRPHSLVDAHGVEHAVDAIVLGTGFEVAAPPIARQIFDGNGRSMAELWAGIRSRCICCVVAWNSAPDCSRRGRRPISARSRWAACPASASRRTDRPGRQCCIFMVALSSPVRRKPIAQWAASLRCAAR
ncbi:flavin-containing monooxygenase [Burkholderia cenocepacia]|uniref:flavin-containing monooxygenase n=1 Tax=Burkholderia cenocepacia TaxID=95486 RepID=UPI002AB01B0B|nr:NAD(P)/FAD-dependent oxidoreductase [Burkholderia cenocepacia]